MEEPRGEVRRVADRVLDRILSGAYPAGLRIPSETDLATALGCGRSTVREALRHLATLGVVRSRRGSGAVVLDYRREGSLALLGPYLTSGKLDQPLGVVSRELLRMRTLLACEGARLAALYATHATLEPARALVERSRSLEHDAAAHSLNDLELHRALVSSSGLWPAVWLANAVWQPLGELARRFPVLAVVPPAYAQAMTHLLDLIEAHEVEAAVDLIEAHLGSVDRLVVSMLGPIADSARTAVPSGRLRLAASLSRRNGKPKTSGRTAP